MAKRTRGRMGERKPSGVVAMLGGIAVVGLIGAAVVFVRPSASSPTGNTSAVAKQAAVATPTTATRPLAEAPTRGAVPTPGAAPGKKSGGAPAAVTTQDGVVRLPVGDFSDSKARFYTFQAANKTIPFFVLKSSDGVIRAAFNACDVCYTAQKGYHQEGDEMVCNNCGSRFSSIRINEETGGCNPSPLVREMQGDNILIKAADLEAGAKYF